MKKKILLLTALTALSVGAMSFILSSNQFGMDIVNTRGEYDSTFRPHDTLPEPVEEGSHRLVGELKNEKNAKLGYVIENATIATYGDNKFILLEEESGVYNTTSIQGISNLSLTLAGYNTENPSTYNIINVVAMCSYHEITLENVFDGQYQDLFYASKSIYLSSGETTEIELDKSAIPHLLDCRYVYLFLSVVRGHAVIYDISVTAECAGEPEEVPMGVRSTSFSATDQTNIRSVLTPDGYPTDEQLPRPGRTVSSVQYYESVSYKRLQITTFAKIDENDFFDSLEAHNFVKTADMMQEDERMIYYQRNGSPVLSFMIAGYETEHYAFYQALFSDEMPLIYYSSTWPSAEINAFTPDEYDDLVVPFEESYVTQYMYMMDGNQFAVAAQLDLDKLTPEDEKDINDYIEAFKSEGFTYKKGTYSSSYGWVYVDDGKFNVSFGSSEAMFTVNINFVETSDEFISVEDIREALKMPSDYDARLHPFCGQGEFSAYPPVYRGESGVAPAGATSFTYYGYNVSDEDLLTYGNQLEERHYVYNSNTDSYVYSIGDIYGSKISVSMSRDEEYNEVRFVYSYYTDVPQDSDFNEFANCVDFDNPSEATALLEEVSSNCTFKVSHNESQKGYVYGTGTQAFLNRFMSLSNTMYVPQLDIYLYNHSSYDSEFTGDTFAYKVINDQIINAVRFERLNLSLSITNSIAQQGLADYENFNTVLYDFLDELGHTEDYFELTQGDSFLNNSYEQQSYINTIAKVDEMKNHIIEKINDNGHYTYSINQGMYIDKESQIAIQVEVNYLTSDYAKLNITFSANQPYNDYMSYNELEMGNIELIADNFPELPYDKDTKLYLPTNTLPGTMYQYKVLLDDVSEYAELLEDAGFSYDSSEGGSLSYYKLVDNYLIYFVYYSSSENDHTMVFVGDFENQFKSFPVFYAGLDSAAKSLLGECGFASDTFSEDALALYLGVDLMSPGHSIYLYDTDEEMLAYRTYLFENGYTVNNNVYSKVVKGESSITTYEVTIAGSGPFYKLIFNKTVVNLKSWNDILTEIEEGGHDYATIRDYVQYPDNVAGYVFTGLSDCSENRVVITATLDFNVQAYVAYIQTHSEFNDLQQIDTYFYYCTFNNGYVQIYRQSSSYTIIVYFHGSVDPTPDPIPDPDPGIVVSGELYMGDNSVQFNGEYTYYQFTPDEDGTYTIVTSNTDEGVDPILQLLDGKTVLEENDDGAGDLQSMINYELEGGHTYTIGFRCWSNEGSGNINISKAPDVSFEKDVYIGDNSVDFDSGDGSLYRFVINESGYYQFTSSYENIIACDPACIIYNAGMIQIAGSDGELEGGNFQFYRYMEAGTYYIRTFSYDSNDGYGNLYIEFFGEEAPDADYVEGLPTSEFFETYLGREFYLPEELETFLSELGVSGVNTYHGGGWNFTYILHTADLTDALIGFFDEAGWDAGWDSDNECYCAYDAGQALYIMIDYVDEGEGYYTTYLYYYDVIIE